jgi:hypothetical protein
MGQIIGRRQVMWDRSERTSGTRQRTCSRRRDKYRRLECSRQEIVNMGQDMAGRGQDTAEERGQWTLTGLHTVCGIHSLILLLHCIILW